MHRTFKYAVLMAFGLGSAAALFSGAGRLLGADKPKRAAAAKAEPKPSDRFGAVRGWTLICTVNADDNDFSFDDRVIDPKGAGKFKQKVSRRHSIVARIVLNDFKENNALFQWTGKGDAHYEVSLEQDGDTPIGHGHTVESASGSKETKASLSIDRKTGTYKFRIGKESIPGTITSEFWYNDPRVEAIMKKEKGYQNPKTVQRNLDVGAMVNYFEVARDLPAQGLPIGGDSALPVAEYLKENSALTEERLHIGAPIAGSMTWELIPNGLEILDLEIVPEKAYKDWLPRGDLKDPEKPGNQLKFVANLTAEDGKEVRSKATQFFFELEKTSSEPGVCMNWPAPGGSATTSFDLKFARDNTTDVFPFQEGDQVAVSKPGATTHVVAEVSSYDFGGYGRLKVRAELDNHRVVYGHLSGDRSRTRILIPYRENESSKVAKKYKDDFKIPDANDSDDKDKSPDGNSPVGDGLCVYEEYRGFATTNEDRASPKFARLDPMKKNLLVRDERSNGDIAGIHGYEYVSGVDVALVPAGGHQKRVVNFNHSSAAPHLCDQHVILVRTGSAGLKRLGGRSFLIVPENPSKAFYTPADVEAIEDNSAHSEMMMLGEPSKSDLEEAAADFVRQLLRATGGHYHGNGDEGPVQWIMDKKGTVRENGKVVKVMFEANDGNIRQVDTKSLMFPYHIDQPITIRLGRQKGRYSGVQDCIMRYHDAEAYVSSTDPSVRFVAISRPAEGLSINLCTSAQGTGVNKAPHPRYGDATFGACKNRIHVSDVK